MITRTLQPVALRLARQYPVVTVTGPRQSGKTTLCRMAFPRAAYVSLEALDDRQHARNDPRGFLARFTGPVILDEIQRVPELLSYIQTSVDELPRAGRFILTGSAQFELLDHVSQSLAGRTALLKLLPFTYDEAYRRRRPPSLETMLWTGFYPRIHDRHLDPAEALSFYFETYVERDVRSLLNIHNLSQFERFVQLCAGRTGQILNLSSLGNDCGVTHNTARAWLSVLEASYVVCLVRSHHANFSKRLVKAPKLYFIDTGLAANLIGIEHPRQLSTHPLRGALFETFAAVEFLKCRFNDGLRGNLFYWRDNTGHEADLLLECGRRIVPVEIKSGQTVCDDFFTGIRFYQKLNAAAKNAAVVYGGAKDTSRHNTAVVGFRSLEQFYRSALRSNVHTSTGAP